MQKSKGLKGLWRAFSKDEKGDVYVVRGKLQHSQGERRNKADSGGDRSCMCPELNRAKCYLCSVVLCCYLHRHL